MNMDKQNSKKYQYTKQILKIAKEHRYTNEDIAVKAGLSKKSVAQVTRWLHGEALATERQMGHFIKEFGHLVKRRTEHLFYSYCSYTIITSSLLKLISDLGLSHKITFGSEEMDLGHLTEDQTLKIADKNLVLPSKSAINLSEKIHKESKARGIALNLYDCGALFWFFKIRGEMLMKYTIRTLKAPRQPQRALLRVVVLRESEWFHLILQRRGTLDHGVKVPLVLSDEEAMWWSEPEVSLGADELLQRMDELAIKLRLCQFPELEDKDVSVSAGIELPFKIRSALVKNGIDVKGVIDSAEVFTIKKQTQ